MMSESDTIRFLLDEHMPIAILHGLRRWGIDATSVDELRLKGAGDPRLVVIARAERRIIITRDSDFVELAQQGIGHPGIVFVSTLSISRIMSALRLVHGAMSATEISNRVEYASGLT
jgi:predicted nuclease of predicted toxin-antitoxin system